MTATLDPWDLRDPAAFLPQLHDLEPLAPGRTVLALVEKPATEQQIVGSLLLSDGDPLPTDLVRHRDLMAGAARSLCEGQADTWPPTHSFVIVVARHGRVVFRESDLAWAFELIDCNHLQPAYDGDVILVTEHGWRCMGDLTAGRYPALPPPGARDEEPS